MNGRTYLALLVVLLAAWGTPVASAGSGGVVVAPDGTGLGNTTGQSDVGGPGIISCWHDGIWGSFFTCQYSVASGTESILLVASSVKSSVFGGWQGTCPGSASSSPAGGTCGFELAATDPTVTIRPIFTDLRTLSVTKQGGGGGTVVSSPAGIDCGGVCSASFAVGTSVTLTAKPAQGSFLESWGGGCATTPASSSTCTVKLDGSTNATVAFASRQSLSVMFAGTGAGVVSGSPGELECRSPAPCSASIDIGTTMTLTPVPEAGSVFAGWSGSGCTGTGPCQVAITTTTLVTATFDAAPVRAGLRGWRTTRSGRQRVTQVTLDVDEQVAVTVSIRRGGVVVASRTVERLLPGKRVVALRIPRHVAAGRAALTMVLTNEAGSSATARGRIRIPPRT